MNFKQLMERAKAGDSAAVTELLMMYRPLLLKEAILDSNLDEDLYQEQRSSDYNPALKKQERTKKSVPVFQQIT